jgi:hypothetical protein
VSEDGRAWRTDAKKRRPIRRHREAVFESSEDDLAAMVQAISFGHICATMSLLHETGNQ